MTQREQAGGKGREDRMIAELQLRQKQIIQKGGEEEAGGAQQTQSKLRLVSAAGSETAAGGRNRRLSSSELWGCAATPFKA